LPGFTGDPFQGCVIEKLPPPDPCYPNPCGANAICKAQGSAGSCVCQDDYIGDPYVACRPECVTNSDCYGHGRKRACINNHCVDPCSHSHSGRVCGINAVCNVINQDPICSCLQGYLGDPNFECHPPPSKTIFLNQCCFIKCEQIFRVYFSSSAGINSTENIDPCDPDPCGPFSQKRERSGYCSCSCLPGYKGSPPNCR
jgi:hypothetical protein